MNNASREFAHPALGEEVEAIGGRYTLQKEEALDFRGRTVLYLIGVGVFDSTCCGAGGCGYAVVPGYLVRRISSGMSEVAPITEEAERKEIELAIKARENISQVNFLG